jgi:hypothetical protein
MSAVTRTKSSKPKQSVFDWIPDHWFATFLIVYGIWVWLPFLAPILMKLGLTTTGSIVYFIYSFFCHQLPERSFFLLRRKDNVFLG